jgi:hypothetical protein
MFISLINIGRESLEDADKVLVVVGSDWLIESKGSKGRNKRLKRLEKSTKKRGRLTRYKKNNVFFYQLDPRI